MRVRLVIDATIADSDDIRGLSEAVAARLEDLGGARLITSAVLADGAPVKVGRGPYRNVMLSDVGVRELNERFGAARVAALIADFSYKLYQKNYKFKDHYAVLVEWAEEREGETPSADGYTSFDGSAATKAGSAQSFDVDEFFKTNIERINGNGN